MRKTLNYAKVKEICERSIRDNCPDIDYDGVYKVREESFAFRSATRLLRAIAPKFSEFVTNVRQYYSSFTPTVPMIPVPGEPDMVRVFLKLPIDYWPESRDAEVLTVWTHGVGVLQSFWDQYQSDVSDSKRCQAWAPNARAWKRIRTSEKMPLSTALSRYSNLKGESSTRIRDVAEYVVELYRPVELLWAETPEDFSEMYAQDGVESCMREHPDREWYDRLNPHGVTATSWYAFHPYIVGAYLKRGGRVINRTLVYTGEDNKRYYGRVYSGGGEGMRQKFLGCLRKEGIEELPDGTFYRPVKFSVPGYRYDNEDEEQVEWVCPSPYLDNIRGNITVSFDRATKSFNFSITKSRHGGIEGNWIHGTRGYSTHNEYAEHVECVECGTAHVLNTERSNGGDYYCSIECAHNAGLVRTRRRNGSFVLRPRAGVIVDALDEHIAFENEVTALAYGGQWYPFGINLPPENPGYTAAGYRYRGVTGDARVHVPHDRLYEDIVASTIPEDAVTRRTVRAFDYVEEAFDVAMVEVPPPPSEFKTVYDPLGHVYVDYSFVTLGRTSTDSMLTQVFPQQQDREAA